MKVAIVYDRVNKFGGAERVLLQLNKMFPDAPLYTSVYNKKNADWAVCFPKIYSSFVQKIPFAKNNHEFFSLLMPIAFEQFRFDEYDLVISVTSEYAKGVITYPGTKHICYLLTPTRYLWSAEKIYFKNRKIKLIISFLIKYLKRYDRVLANRPDIIFSISKEVQKRTKKYYCKNTKVIYPPVSLYRVKSNFIPKEKNYLLIVARLVDYKRIDIAIKACELLDKKLIIIGKGRVEKKLKKISTSKNIVFKKNIADEELVGYYKHADAFLMPQEEDFGIAAVEAQSFGIPVIAYACGGSIDIVKNGLTGVLFNEQSVYSLMNAIKKFEKISFNKDLIKNNARRFSDKNFEKNFLKII